MHQAKGFRHGNDRPTGISPDRLGQANLTHVCERERRFAGAENVRDGSRCCYASLRAAYARRHFWGRARQSRRPPAEGGLCMGRVRVVPLSQYASTRR
jgi:hypothetical protein